MTDQVQAMPLRSFEYGGAVRTPRKGVFPIDRRTAAELEASGLLRIVRQAEDPTPAAGAQQSASPVAPASPQTMLSASVPGARRGRPKKQGESS
jgi:hypothetical protein